MRRVVLLSVALLAAPAAADFMAYHGAVTLRADAGPITAEHHHDWTKRGSRGPSWIRVTDTTSRRRVLLERSSPPLTTLWLSPDGGYLVGLSQIKYANKVQLLVLSRDGSYAHEEAVRCGDPRLKDSFCMESVTNNVHWYDPQEPALELVVEGGQPRELSLNGPPGRVVCDTLKAVAEDGGAPVPERCSKPVPRIRFVLSPPRASAR